MIDRRRFLGITAGAGASLALTPQLLRALGVQQPGGKLLQRAIPSSGEMLPVISFGARSLGGAALSSQPADVVALKALLKTFLDNGGKVVDILHGGPPSEQSARQAAAELGIQDRFLWTMPLAGPAPVREQVEQKLAAFKVPRLDLVMVGSLGDVPGQVAALQELKKEGKVRYIGVHHLAFLADRPLPAGVTSAFGNLESFLRNEPIDVVATDYSVGDRRAEETILPLAMERKVGFMAYFPFDRGRLFDRVRSTPLPAWAAEFDARTWSQFFLKYVVSHPGVVMAREGTTDAAHMIENIGGGTGRLPNEAMRKRMAEFVNALPSVPPGPLKGTVLSAAILDRYVGEYTTPTGDVISFRRDGTTLFVKPPGTAPEAPLLARSEIRFRNPQGRIFEFHVDEQGRATGALLEQPPRHLKLVRK